MQTAGEDIWATLGSAGANQRFSPYGSVLFRVTFDTRLDLFHELYCIHLLHSMKALLHLDKNSILSVSYLIKAEYVCLDFFS